MLLQQGCMDGWHYDSIENAVAALQDFHEAEVKAT